MDPLVSIITTTHNIVENGMADDFTMQCSLLDKQTYPEIEHIVIDKASTDDTTVLLKDFKNQGYIEFYSEPDMNKFDAYNKGILKANGKYIAFLSCDDFYHDITAIYNLVLLMETENADFSFSPSYCRHPKGFVFRFMPSMHNVFQVSPCSRQSMFFKKEVLEKENGFDTKFRFLSDYDLVIRLMMKKYKGVFFPMNYTTYKLGQKMYENEPAGNIEAKAIFLKNYKPIYPDLTDDILEKMVSVSEFPKELLDKLVTYFPKGDKDLFYEKCEQMKKIRTDAVNNKNSNERE